MQLETRNVTLFGPDGIELRVGEGETPHRFVGTIPFLSLSQDLGGFKERLMPTAFKSSLASGQDIRALVDHDAAKLLGRTSNGTLRVAPGEKGLAVEMDLPDTSYGRDIRTLVARRDIRGLSFGFKVREGGQRFLKEGGLTVRELHDIDLREISVVSLPAYADTDVAIRSAVIDPSVIEELRASKKIIRLQTARFLLALQTM